MVSHRDKPGDGRKSFVAGMCTQCGRTDLKRLSNVQELVRGIVGLSRVPSVFPYSITPGMCPDCGIRALPHTGAVSGISLGPKAGAIPYSHKSGKRSAMEAGDNFRDVRHRKLSNGAISNCTRAIAADIKWEVMEIRPKSTVLESSDGRPFRSPVSPPPEPQANRYEEYDSLPARYRTVRTMSRPLPATVQILEKSTMDPWSQTDESRYGIGKEVQALVHDTLPPGMDGGGAAARREHAAGLGASRDVAQLRAGVGPGHNHDPFCAAAGQPAERHDRTGCCILPHDVKPARPAALPKVSESSPCQSHGCHDAFAVAGDRHERANSDRVGQLRAGARNRHSEYGRNHSACQRSQQPSHNQLAVKRTASKTPFS